MTGVGSNETVWELPKETVALRYSSVYSGFCSICYLVDARRCGFFTASKSLVDGDSFSGCCRGTAGLYGVVHAASLRRGSASAQGLSFG